MTMRSAIEVADRVLASSERADLRDLAASALVTKGTALAYLGRPIEGLALIGAGQAVAQAEGLSLTEVRAHLNRASVEAIRDPRTGSDVARAGLVVVASSRSCGVGDHAAVRTASIAALRTGDWRWALVELEMARARPTLEEASTVSHHARLAAAVPVPPRGAGHRGPSRRCDIVVPEHRIRACSRACMPRTARSARARPARRRAEWHVTRGRDLDRSTCPMRCAASARSALWLRDAAAAARTSRPSTPSGVHGPAIEADRMTIRAGLAALEGTRTRPLRSIAKPCERGATSASPGTRHCAGSTWRRSSTLGPGGSRGRGGRREILVRLEAAPFIERLDAAMAVAPAPVRGCHSTRSPEPVDSGRAAAVAAAPPSTASMISGVRAPGRTTRTGTARCGRRVPTHSPGIAARRHRDRGSHDDHVHAFRLGGGDDLVARVAGPDEERDVDAESRPRSTSAWASCWGCSGPGRFARGMPTGQRSEPGSITETTSSSAPSTRREVERLVGGGRRRPRSGRWRGAASSRAVRAPEPHASAPAGSPRRVGP